MSSSGVDVDLKIDDHEMVVLTSLDLAVTSFQSKLKKRMFPETAVQSGIQPDTGKFQISTEDQTVIVKCTAQFLGSYSIPDAPTDPVIWNNPVPDNTAAINSASADCSADTADTAVLPVFCPRTYQCCPDWLHTILKHKCAKLPDGMVVSLILGEMMELGKFESVGYIQGNNVMFAFGLTQIDWLVDEIPEEEFYKMPPNAVLVERSEIVESSEQ